VVWCRERWTPRRDLMKPSRGLLKPARCAVALVQLAVPTGGLLQAIEAADIKRALRGSGTWGEGSGVRCGARLLEPYPRLHDRRNPRSGARHEIDAPPALRRANDGSAVRLRSTHARARCKPPCVSSDGLHSGSDRSGAKPSTCIGHRPSQRPAHVDPHPDRPCVDGDATATLAVCACMIKGQEVLMGCRIVSNGVGHW